MSLYRLKIFNTVAKWGSITKACGEIHISQPAVSRQLRLLEQDCGVKLYKTTGRGIELTEQGQLFLREADSFLVQVDKLLKLFKTDKETGTLTVGASYSPSASILPSVLAAFQETRPELKLILRTDSSAAIEQLVLNLEIEMGVICRPSHSPLLTYEAYRQEELTFFVSSKHPLAKRPKLTLTDLAKTPIVTLTGKTDEANVLNFLGAIKKRGLRLNVLIQCESPEAVKNVVRTTMVAGILDRAFLDWDLKRGDLRTVNVPEPRMQYDSFIVYLKEKTFSSQAQPFLNLLRNYREESGSLMKRFSSAAHH